MHNKLNQLQKREYLLRLRQALQAGNSGVRRTLQKLLVFVGWGFLILGIIYIVREVDRIGSSEVFHELREVGIVTWVTSTLVTALFYLLLSCYDVLAIWYIHGAIKIRQALFAGFIGYAFSNAISMIPSIALRTRLYLRWGLTGKDIGQVFIFHILTTWVGFITVLAVALVGQWLPTGSGQVPIPLDRWSWAGWCLAGLIVLYLVLCLIGSEKIIKIPWVGFKVPSLPIALGQVGLSCVDWFISSSILYVILPSAFEVISYPHFLGIFLVAQAIQIVSHAPGGLGVFESAILILLGNYYPSVVILVSVFVYRIVFFIFPLLIALGVLLIYDFLVFPKRSS